MLRVCRESQQTKVKDLMRACPELIDEMQVNKKLSNMKVQITPEILSNLKDFSSVISLIISMTQLFFQKRINHFRDNTQPPEV